MNGYILMTNLKVVLADKVLCMLRLHMRQMKMAEYTDYTCWFQAAGDRVRETSSAGCERVPWAAMGCPPRPRGQGGPTATCRNSPARTLNRRLPHVWPV